MEKHILQQKGVNQSNDRLQDDSLRWCGWITKQNDTLIKEMF